jgi:hypothetical protein
MNSSTNGEYGILVSDGGEMKIHKGSLVTAKNASNHYTFIVRSGATIEITGSTIKECGYDNNVEDLGLYIQTNNALIDNSVITSNHYGLFAVYANITLTNSSITNNTGHGAYLLGSHESEIHNNNLSANSGYGIATIKSTANLADMTLNGNHMDGIGSLWSNLTLMNVTSINNWRLGILAQSTNATFTEGRFQNNTMCDVYLTGHNGTSMTGPADVELLDTIFDTHHLHDHTCSINASFHVNLEARWSASNQRISDATIQLFNNSYTGGGLAYEGIGGLIENVLVRTLMENGSVSLAFTPHTLVASKNTWKGEVEANITRPGQLFTVYVDNMVPLVNITAPSDGSLLNDTEVVVQGTAWDFDGISEILVSFNNGPWLQVVGTDNWFINRQLSDGVWNATVIARDNYNFEGTASVGFKIDTMPPQIMFTAPNDGFVTNSLNLTLFGRTEENAQVWINDEEVIPSNGIFSYTSDLVEGINEFTARAVDLAGNWNQSTLTILRDTAEPILNVTSPEDHTVTNRSNVTVTGTVIDGAGVRVDGEDYMLVSGKFNATATLDEGDNGILVEAWDDAGNIAMATVHVIRDTIAPVITLEILSNLTHVPAHFMTNRVLFTVNGSVNEQASVFLDGVETPVEKGVFSGNVTLTEGMNLVIVEAVDLAGNRNQTWFEILLDIRPPYITIDNPSEGDRMGSGQVNLYGTASDDNNLTEVMFRVDGGQWKTPTGLGSWYTTLSLDPGVHIIEARAVDITGNVAVISVNFTITKLTDTTPPEIRIESPLPDEVVRGKIVIVKGSAVDDTGVAIVMASLDNETWINCEGLTFWSVSFNFSTGTHTVFIKAVDLHGNENVTRVSFTVKEAQISDGQSTFNFAVISLILILVIIFVGGYMAMSIGKEKKKLKKFEKRSRGLDEESLDTDSEE